MFENANSLFSHSAHHPQPKYLPLTHSTHHPQPKYFSLTHSSHHPQPRYFSPTHSAHHPQPKYLSLPIPFIVSKFRRIGERFFELMLFLKLSRYHIRLLSLDVRQIIRSHAEAVLYLGKNCEHFVKEGCPLCPLPGKKLRTFHGKLNSSHKNNAKIDVCLLITSSTRSHRPGECVGCIISHLHQRNLTFIRSLSPSSNQSHFHQIILSISSSLAEVVHVPLSGANLVLGGSGGFFFHDIFRDFVVHDQIDMRFGIHQSRITPGIHQSSTAGSSWLPLTPGTHRSSTAASSWRPRVLRVSGRGRSCAPRRQPGFFSRISFSRKISSRTNKFSFLPSPSPTWP
jgi:hypothetical protein